MKHLKYILIINLGLFYSCSQEPNQFNEINVSEEDKVNMNTKTESTKAILDSNNSLSPYNSMKDSIIDSKINKLEVIIEERIYYKKNTSDFRVGDSYYFRTKDNSSEYNIKTGKYNHNYQLPHGGKVIIDTIR